MILASSSMMKNRMKNFPVHFLHIVNIYKNVAVLIDFVKTNFLKLISLPWAIWSADIKPNFAINQSKLGN